MARGSNVKKIGGVIVALCVLGAGLVWATHRHYVAPRTSPTFDQRPQSDALVEAASNGDLAKMKALLDSGVSPNAGEIYKEGEGGSALSAAAGCGQLAAVKLLLDRGADVNADDFWGGSALVQASLSGEVDVVKLLLARGADPNMEDDEVTALDYALGQQEHPEDGKSSKNYAAIIGMLRSAGGHRSLMFTLLSIFHK